MTTDLAAFRVVAIGHVQGVGFRAFVQSTCRARGIGGWVRNRDDGAVEAELYGPRSAAEQAVADIRAGRAHQLRRLTVDPVPLPVDLSSQFEIRW
jgi:acylphosphatase